MRTNKPAAKAQKVKRSWRIGIVTSSYYKEEVDAMVAGAKAYLKKAGITKISLHEAPGCFEIPLIGAALAEKKKVDGLIGLGIIVEGQTHHARLLAEQTARGMMDVQIRYRMPFAFEVLYVNDLADAAVRSVGKGNKGEEAGAAVLRSLSQLKSL